MDNIFVFDIETVPDVEAGRKLYSLPQTIPDHEVAEAMSVLRAQSHGSHFLPLHLQKIVAISALFMNHSKIKLWSLGTLESDEKDLITRFFNGIEQFKPTLVSWNGSGFDLPVLHYRSLFHAVNAAQYWEMGDMDNSYRYNNYLNRYHYRHIDVMDVLACYQARATAPLNHIASMLGFPGKMGMDGSKVWTTYLAGDLKSIRDYCETDVINTFLVYLRFELMRGNLDAAHYQSLCGTLRAHLTKSDEHHLVAFNEAWHAEEIV